MAKVANIKKLKTRRRKMDFSVSEILGKLERGEIVLPPFQREKVWKRANKSEAIYSLMAGLGLLPLVLLELSNGSYLLLDGRQRVSAIKDFVDNKFSIRLNPRLKHNPQIASLLEGKKFKDLPKEYQKALMNEEISAVVYEVDDEGKENDIAIELFERINLTPVLLSPGEMLFTLFYAHAGRNLSKVQLIDQTAGEINEKENLRKALFRNLIRLLVVYGDLEKWRGGSVNFSNIDEYLLKGGLEFLKSVRTKRLEKLLKAVKAIVKELKSEKLSLAHKSYLADLLAPVLELYEKEFAEYTPEDFAEVVAKDIILPILNKPELKETLRAKYTSSPSKIRERVLIANEAVEYARLKKSVYQKEIDKLKQKRKKEMNKRFNAELRKELIKNVVGQL